MYSSVGSKNGAYGAYLRKAWMAAGAFSRLVLPERRDKGSPDGDKDHETRLILPQTLL
jgi:hypothetical protein